MNIKEFAALEVGDKIHNPMSRSDGVVTECKSNGVEVRWGTRQPGRSVSFFYSVNSTAWMHWVKA